MRFGITSALSAAGVVAAGVAAFTLNSAVLSSPGTGVSDDAARAAALGAVTTTDATGTGATPGNVSAASPGTPVTANSTAVSDTVTSYRVGTAGTVIVDSSGGTLKVTDVIPAAGWVSEPARTAADGTVKVHFVRSPDRIEFFASVVDGKVTVSVVNESAPMSPAAPARPGTPGASNPVKPSVPWAGNDDDDDDDDHHDDDDDDDDHGPGHHEDGHDEDDD